jgi:hypothetical protein
VSKGGALDAVAQHPEERPAMNYATAPRSRRNAAMPHHGILPSATLALGNDWSDLALQRTWRSAGVLLMLIGLLNAFVARLPALLFFLLGVWAHLKGDPVLRDRLARHPIVGAPLRWWLARGRSKLAARR